MSENKIVTVTTLQKELLLGHLGDMNGRLQTITEEISCLSANFKAMNMILENTTEISLKK